MSVSLNHVEQIYGEILQSADYKAGTPDHMTPVCIEDFGVKTQVAASVIGMRLLNDITGAGSETYITRWIEGSDRPTIVVARRLCIAEVITQKFASWFPDAVHLGETSPDVQSWLTGENPVLASRSPARVIRSGVFTDAASSIAAALFDLRA